MFRLQFLSFFLFEYKFPEFLLEYLLVFINYKDCLQLTQKKERLSGFQGMEQTLRVSRLL